MRSFRQGDHLTITNLGRGVKTLKVETPLGIVNIYTGLTDAKGRRVERVYMVPDRAADQPVKLYGNRFVELKKKPVKCLCAFCKPGVVLSKGGRRGSLSGR